MKLEKSATAKNNHFPLKKVNDIRKPLNFPIYKSVLIKKLANKISYSGKGTSKFEFLCKGVTGVLKSIHFIVSE